jgi:Ca2+-binding EF-hand superfamily protein
MKLPLTMMFLVPLLASSQEYGGGEDNLYHDYAQKQQMKLERGLGLGGGNAFGFGHGVAAVVGFGLGKIHSRRTVSNLKKKHEKAQKNLYSQYYNDVYKMQEQIAEFSLQADLAWQHAESTKAEAEMQQLQRDYDEFKQPDIDGDDRISRAEFNMYVKNYLVNYPGLAEKDYPMFEDFDHDHDGFVSFTEYAQQMALQVQQAEWDAQNGGGKQAQQQLQGLQGLYGETQKKRNFEDLYANYR